MGSHAIVAFTSAQNYRKMSPNVRRFVEEFFKIGFYPKFEIPSSALTTPYKELSRHDVIALERRVKYILGRVRSLDCSFIQIQSRAFDGL